MKVFKILSFEWYCPAEHGIKQDTQAPYIYEKALIAFVYYNFRGKISRCPALFLNDLTLFDNFRYTEVTYLDALLAIQEDVIKLDVSMNDRAAVDVS